MRFSKTKGKEDTNPHFLSQHLVQLRCATCLDQVLTQPWTKFWLNVFDSFWPCLPFANYAETIVYGVFSKNVHILSPPQKIRNTICEHNCVDWQKVLFFFGGGVCRVRFLCPFFERNEKTKQKATNQNKITNKGNKTTRYKQEKQLALLQKKKAESRDTKQYIIF